MNLENRNVRGILIAGRTIPDEISAAITASRQDDRRTGNNLHPATDPVVRYPRNEIRFHFDHPRSQIASSEAVRS